MPCARFLGPMLVAVLFVAGCAHLYSENPRHGRRAVREPTAQPQPRVQPRMASRKGSLPWPVRGVLIGTFGSRVDPKYKTITKSPGVEITTVAGTPVTAVDSGTVSFADQFMGFGKMIILDHGSRYHTIYSRLADVRVSVGARVARGDVIATAGDTLHFEFRVGGRSVDPLEWLEPR